jgi:hypothetical protein
MAGQISPNRGHEALVEVFDTMEESEALVVKGLLESSGIPALVSALDAPQDVLPGVGGVVVRVPREQAEEARQLIAEQLKQGLDSTAAPESQPSGPEPEGNSDLSSEDA